MKNRAAVTVLLACMFIVAVLNWLHPLLAIAYLLTGLVVGRVLFGWLLIPLTGDLLMACLWPVVLIGGIRDYYRSDALRYLGFRAYMLARLARHSPFSYRKEVR